MIIKSQVQIAVKKAKQSISIFAGRLVHYPSYAFSMVDLEEPVSRLEYEMFWTARESELRLLRTTMFHPDCISDNGRYPRNPGKPNDSCFKFQREGAMASQAEYVVAHVNILLELYRLSPSETRQLEILEDAKDLMAIYYRLLWDSIENFKSRDDFKCSFVGQRGLCVKDKQDDYQERDCHATIPQAARIFSVTGEDVTKVNLAQEAEKVGLPLPLTGTCDESGTIKRNVLNIGWKKKKRYHYILAKVGQMTCPPEYVKLSKKECKAGLWFSTGAGAESYESFRFNGYSVSHSYWPQEGCFAHRDQLYWSTAPSTKSLSTEGHLGVCRSPPLAKESGGPLYAFPNIGETTCPPDYVKVSKEQCEAGLTIGSAQYKFNGHSTCEDWWPGEGCFASGGQVYWSTCPSSRSLTTENHWGVCRLETSYRGCQTRTQRGGGGANRRRRNSKEFGYTCQKWTAQSPHKHRFTPSEHPDAGLGDHNYCRNPDGKRQMWCYTTDKDKVWDYCDPVPVHSLPDVCDPDYSDKPLYNTETEMCDWQSVDNYWWRRFQNGRDVTFGKYDRSTKSYVRLDNGKPQLCDTHWYRAYLQIWGRRVDLHYEPVLQLLRKGQNLNLSALAEHINMGDFRWNATPTDIADTSTR